MNVDNSLVASNSAHTSFYPVKIKHSNVGTKGKAHFWLDGDLNYLEYIKHIKFPHLIPTYRVCCFHILGPVCVLGPSLFVGDAEMYFTFTARSITHFHSVSLYFNLFLVKSSINKGCSNWPDTASTLMAPTYMTAITYRGITQGWAGKHSTKSLLAITTPVSLKSILKVGEEIVEVLGTGRPGRCLWLIAGCQVPISPMQRWLWEMWSSFLSSSISLSSGVELGDGRGLGAGGEGGAAHPLTRTNSCSDRKAFNNISKQCTRMCVDECMLVWSRPGMCSLAFTCVSLECSQHHCLIN